MLKNWIQTTLFISLSTIGGSGFALSTQDAGKIYYHLNFPVVLNEQTENIILGENFKDLIMSNVVAGAMYVHLVKAEFPNLQFDTSYMIGSLFGQLLQENLQTSDYQATSDWINPNNDIRNMLLMPGQGGPYQLNDYSKRLEDKIGMINFKVLQKSLGYSIQDQDSGTQTSKKGPDALDNKYFGPLAAAYFQFNDILRLQAINRDPWGPVAQYYESCMSNLKNTPNNFLDMIINATYNAGPWAEITKTYFELCANYNNPSYAEKIKHINDYTLADQAYQQAIGTKESAGSTFILYPRQIRFYLDELYNNPTALKTTNALYFPMSQLRTVFANAMATLAYVNNDGKYVFISTQEAGFAFDQAMETLSLSSSQQLNMSDQQEREKIVNLLASSIDDLEKTLNIRFGEVTEANFN